MTTKEKANENPFHSDCEEILLFDEAISTPSKLEHRYAFHDVIFTGGHIEFQYKNICKVLLSIIYETKKDSKEKTMVKLKLRGGLLRVC